MNNTSINGEMYTGQMNIHAVNKLPYNHYKEDTNNSHVIEEKYNNVRDDYTNQPYAIVSNNTSGGARRKSRKSRKSKKGKKSRRTRKSRKGRKSRRR